MKYRDFYLNKKITFSNSENVLRFNIQVFNTYIALIGSYNNKAPDMAFMRMSECLGSMRRLGTKHLFDVVYTLIGCRIEQLEARDNKNLNYLDKTSLEKGIAFLKGFHEMFEMLRTSCV